MSLTTDRSSDLASQHYTARCEWGQRQYCVRKDFGILGAYTTKNFPMKCKGGGEERGGMVT